MLVETRTNEPMIARDLSRSSLMRKCRDVESDQRSRLWMLVDLELRLQLLKENFEELKKHHLESESMT